MKLAAVDFWIWLIIFVFVMISKAWNKLATPRDDEPAEKPPVAPRPRPQPPQRRPVRPTAAQAGPRQPATPTAMTGRPDWRIDPQKVRAFIEQVQNAQRPAPPSTPARLAPTPVVPAPAAAKPVATARPAPKPALPPPRVAPSSKWVAAFRDRQNLRNIIIANEIFGAPKGL